MEEVLFYCESIFFIQLICCHDNDHILLPSEDVPQYGVRGIPIQLLSNFMFLPKQYYFSVMVVFSFWEVGGGGMYFLVG